MSEPASTQSPPPSSKTSPASMGVLPQWLMALALAVCAVMIVGLLALIFSQGLRSFWPKPIESVILTSGEEVLGIPVRSKVDADGVAQTLYRVGNRDLGQTPFRWVLESDIQTRERPESAVLVERQEWGVFVGRLAPDPSTGEPLSWDRFEQDIEDGRDRRVEMDRLRGGLLSDVNRRLRENRQAVEAAKLRLAENAEGGLSKPLWSLCLGVGVVAVVGGTVLATRRGRSFVPIAVAGVVLLTGGWLEQPSASTDELQAWHTQRVEQLDAEFGRLQAEFDGFNAELEALEAADSEFRVAIEASDGTLAPESQSAADRLLKASQVVRAIQPNAMSAGEKLGVFFSRWRDYLLTDPREANTEGGIFPVIIGTVTVTLLLTIVVVPLGVLAALYIREYAKQGLLISVLRVAINNLAGVPSIVYGIFGLGFFCYTVGGYIDGGPDSSFTLGKATWWVVLLGTASAVASALLFRDRVRLAGVLWAAGVTAALVLFATSPYFDGFFRIKLLDGEPTFGSSGLLWASLTLALLTLPVVIVSTEEAIAAVPQSLREASYGCGASRWQTISRVVLPGAMPGVMTGAILAMARGAGEVAPLMVVGAVKLAPELPVEAEFPFVYADRSFMHLGFHIFDLGFQSPDSEAARGMVWTTTLLLIVLVVTMNLAAIALRGRLRKRLGGGHF
ncbi:MAG: ABC transporter permease subunit [Planctomycetota bacterium]